MLPDNVASTLAVVSNLLHPDSNARSALVDWEQGGIAINDITQGMQVTTWKCFVAEDSDNVMLQPGDGEPIFLAQISGIEELAISFDQNMRPVFAYRTGTNIYLYWYDADTSAFVTTNFGTGRNPSLTLDDKRSFNVSNSDVIFGYIRGSGLYYRTQRDRYQIERQLHSAASDLTLVNVGMNRNLRVQFNLI